MTSWARARTALVAATVVVMTVSGSTLADTELGHGGTVGTHRLRDTTGHPGVRCLYVGFSENEGGIVMDEVVVRPPIVFALDRTGGVDAGRVGWRARLQGQAGSPEAWRTIDVRPIEWRRATDARPAHFARQTFKVDPFGRGGSGAYRVLVDMVWSSRDGGPIVGGAAHRVDRYAAEFHDGAAAATEQTGSCYAAYN